jgi:hypothetical protein
VVVAASVSICPPLCSLALILAHVVLRSFLFRALGHGGMCQC